MSEFLLAVAFAVVAAVYAAAGFGGGSAYLALMALWAVSPQKAATVALICNVIVVTKTSVDAARLKLLDGPSLLAFAWISVPAAFVGGSYRMQERALGLLLAATLFLSGIALLRPKRAIEPSDVTLRTTRRRAMLATLIGAPLGLIAGLVGIGGGVFLSPILHFLKWDSSRRIASLCSAFILVNSVAGLLGKRQALSQLWVWDAWLLLPIAVAIGGSIGSRLMLKTLSNLWIVRATAAVVLVASLQTCGRALARPASSGASEQKHSCLRTAPPLNERYVSAGEHSQARMLTELHPSH